ncbi:MAG: metal ABC transporter permease [Candidatus Riflebacteria bacterium]|nr:metal ABC transporter permease [Candidatus Riflebacteria bacterium]
MSSFLTDLLELPFLFNAVLAGVLCSIAGGIVGTFVVLRRITYIAAAIAHCILGGLGAARYLSVVYGLEWLRPIYGAILTALLSALIIGIISLRAKEREDTVISALWAVGMAAGVLFIFKTPGYGEDLMSYLFGNILMVSSQDLWLIGILDIILLVITTIFYRQIIAVCFDEEFARTRGLSVEFYYLLVLCMTALTVVLMVSAVGIIMVIAMLTLPVAIGCKLFKRVSKIMISATGLGIFFNVFGLMASYEPNLPSGALTIIIAGLTYFATVLFFMFKKTKIRNKIN